MFVISCKYNQKSNYIISLVNDIRKYHPNEKIVVVDSDSEDNSYFKELEKCDVIIEDVHNKNWMIGAYWYSFKKYPHEEFYYFMHDSMRVKDNLDYLKEKDLTLLMSFNREILITKEDKWGYIITKNSKYKYKFEGRGCYGPIFFCKNKVMKIMLDMGADKFLPSNKSETGRCEACYGFFLEEQGYNLIDCSLFGDVFENESFNGKSGAYPFNTKWQFPVEKFYGSHLNLGRI